MKLNLLYVYAVFSVALVVCHAMITPEVYWKSIFPKSPMPKAVMDSLYTTEVGTGKGKASSDVVHPDAASAAESAYIYIYAASKNQPKNNPNVALFFLENDLHHGTEMSLLFTKNENQKAKFLPKKVADSIPFSSQKLPQIYNKLSINPDSTEAKIMKQTLSDCESKGIQGEEKYCATSLESMVEFTSTKLGKNLKAISTEVNAKDKERSPLQKYKIQGTKKLSANKAVVCHKENYAYAVFYCHKTVQIKAYVVSLDGKDGSKVKAVAVCHTDTAKWNPKHLAFQVLKVKPGSVAICHFLPEDHVVWVAY